MKVSDFDYYLPEELIAQDPLEKRSDSRLMVLDKDTGEITHRHFYDIKDYLAPGDCLVINDTRVIPARLLGLKADTGAHAEILLLKRLSDNTWECLARPGRKLKPGSKVVFGEGLLKAEIVSVLEDGNRIVRFYYDGIFEEVLDKLGEMPLPPYITHKLKDKERYQTVYAVHDGSAAAPTAGLHFTDELLHEIEAMGVSIARITLHVGLGTFRPVKADTIEEHRMHSEYYIVGAEAAELINKAMADGHRIISVGTTSTRTLESAAVPNPEFEELISSEGGDIHTPGGILSAESAVSGAGSHYVDGGYAVDYMQCASDVHSAGDLLQSDGLHPADSSHSADAVHQTHGIHPDDGSQISDGTHHAEDGFSPSRRSLTFPLRIRSSDGRWIPRYILRPCEGDTSIFIYPGYEWKIVDSLITNFHLPKSTLIMLVSALAGRDHIMSAYAEAVRERYRFFSFGDAMLIH